MNMQNTKNMKNTKNVRKAKNMQKHDEHAKHEEHAKTRKHTNLQNTEYWPPNSQIRDPNHPDSMSILSKPTENGFRRVFNLVKSHLWVRSMFAYF